METRRSFLVKMCFFFWSMICISACKVHRLYADKSDKPRRALVIWYSQTGHTERYGKLVQAVWSLLGLDVTGSDLRNLPPETVKNYDLILVGSPVFYYDTPDAVKEWIEKIPELSDTPVSSFVSFGGPEGDQHNAACSILSALSKRGGRPVGMDMFMNMGTFPLGWDEDTLLSDNLPDNRSLPDDITYDRVRNFAALLIKRVVQGYVEDMDKKITLRRFSTVFNPIFWTKLSIQSHGIDAQRCIQCGMCQEKCPTQAIDPVNATVNSDDCVLCFGCINVCPQKAVIMMYKDRKLLGFHELLKQKNITIKEPQELMRSSLRQIPINPK